MAKRPLRLLFDENLPWQVAAALNILGFNTCHVGCKTHNPRPPGRGSYDSSVLDHAQTTNQVVVTQNHDMILLCAESRAPVLWIDPYGRQITKPEMVIIGFKGIGDWTRRFDESSGAVCVRALRTKNATLTIEEAARLARNRMRALQLRKKKAAAAKPLGPLLATKDSRR